MTAENTPHSALPETDLVVERLVNFHVIANRALRVTMEMLPPALVVFLLADWLVGSGVFATDILRLSGVLAVVIETLILTLLFRQLPEVLEAIWTRGLLQYLKDPALSQDEYIHFINLLEKVLNSRWSWVVGVVCALGSLSATYPVRYFLLTGQSPFNSNQLIRFYLWGNGAILAGFLGYLLGVLLWRVGVIAVFISKLGNLFKVLAQPNHPDRAGGLKPVGDLCLTIALLLLVPAIFLSAWGFIAVFFPQVPQVYNQVWSGLFRQYLVLLSLLALFVFIQPLYNIHLQMQKRRREIQGELNDLTHRIDALTMELRTQAHTFSSQVGEEKLEALAFMQKVYQENARIPIWPVDWQILLKFVSAQALPVLSLIGTSEPVTKLILSLLSSGGN